MSGARMAIAARTASTLAPKMPIGLWRTRIAARWSGLCSLGATAADASRDLSETLSARVTAMRSAVPTQADAWIGKAAQQVDAEIHQQIHDDQEQQTGLHDRVVAIIDGREDQTSHARPAERVLHDHHPANQKAELQADDGDYRNQRIPERMTEHQAEAR